MTTYRRRAHTRVVNGKTVHVRGTKVNGPDPRVAWLDALFSKRDRDDDDDAPADRFAAERAWTGCSPDCPDCRAVADEQYPGVHTNTEAHDGWQVGDQMCDRHRTGYDPGCMTCRRLAGLDP